MHRLILCGGGHVAHALAQVCAALDFTLCVVDDRAEFANAQRFPTAAQVIAAPFAAALDALAPGPGDYVCILTRGHAFDTDCAAHVLPRGCDYVGMIGSRRKCALVRAQLAESGLSDLLIASLHAPIGMDIGAESPAEIAISIAAQLIAVRAAHGGAVQPLPDGAGVEVAVTQKSGSAPRGVGVRMLVTPDGAVCGTIGGGSLEFLAVQAATALLQAGGTALTRTYDLSGEASDPAMVCGGTVTLQFTVR